MSRIKLLLNNISALESELKSLYQQLEQEKDDMFSAIVKTTPDFIAIIQDEKFVFVNPAGLKLLQCKSSSDIVGQNIFKFLHPDFHTIIKQRLKNLKNNKPNAPIEVRMLKTDGEYISLETRSTPFLYNNKTGGLIVGRDITDELLHQQKLKESEQRFREIFENSNDNIFLLEVTDDMRFRNLDFNPAFEKNTGRKRSDLIGKFQEEVVPAEVAQIRYKQYRHCVENKEALLNKEIKLELPVGTRTFLSSIIPIPDSNGKIYRIMGIYRDVTDQKHYEQHLKDSLHFIEKIINSIPEPIFIKDRQHKFILSNDAHCKFRGCSREELIGKTDFDLFPEQKAKNFWEDEECIFETGKETIHDDVLTDDEGNLSYIVLRKVSFTGLYGKKYLAGTIHNITERKKAEEQLRESEMKFRSLAENLPDYITRFDTSGRIQYMNKRVIDGFGIDLQDIIGKTLLNHSVPGSPTEDRRYHDAIMQAVRESVPNTLEGVWNTKKGEGIFEIRHIPEKDANGNVVSVLGIARDITEQKQNMREIELLGFAIDNTSDAIFISEQEEKRFSYVNRQACKSLGYTREELLHMTPFDIDPDITEEAVNQILSEADTHNFLSFESRHKRKDGSIFPVEVAVIYFDYGSKRHTMIHVRDITERKQYRQNLEILTHALNNTSEAAFIVEMSNPNFLYVNDQACKSLGYGRQELMKKTLFDIDPFFTEEQMHKSDAVLISNGFISFEAIHKRKDGTVFPVECTVSYYQYNNTNYLISLARDITERKRAEEVLQEERKLFIGGPNVSFVWKAVEGWPVEYVSPNVADQFGYMPDDFTSGKIPFASIIHPDDLQRIANEVEHYSEEGVPYFEQEYRIARMDDEYCWVYDFTIVVRDFNGEITNYKGYITDITKRKQTEIALRESEQRYREMFDNSHDSIFLLEVLDGARFRLLDVNPKYEKEVGIDREKHLGHTMEENTTPEVAAAVNAKYQRCVDAGMIIEETIELTMPQGPRTYHSTLVPIRDNSGKIYRIMGITRDVTEEIQAKRALEVSQKRLSKAELVALMGHVEYDFENDMNYWSEGAYEILNMSKELRRPGKEGYIERIHPDDIERVKAAMEKTAKELVKFDEVYKIIDFRGNEKMIHGTGRRQIDENGKPSNFFGIIQDITFMHELNARLHAEEEKFRILAESSPVGIFTSIGKKPVYVNKAILNMIGVNSMSDLADLNLEDLIFPEDKIKVKRLAEKLDAGEIRDTPYKLTLRNLTRDNVMRYYDLYVTTFELNHEKHIQIIVIDVTNDREKEKIQHKLAADSLYINLKNKLTDEIKVNLEKIFTVNKTYKKHDFKAVYNILKSCSQSDKDWELLKKHFEYLHPEFIIQLKKKAPSLTVNEIRHCACIRMNLDTKEIARFFNVKPSSVQTSRVRLKKKLKLPEETDLRDFILNL